MSPLIFVPRVCNIKIRDVCYEVDTFLYVNLKNN